MWPQLVRRVKFPASWRKFPSSRLRVNPQFVAGARPPGLSQRLPWSCSATWRWWIGCCPRSGWGVGGRGAERCCPSGDMWTRRVSAATSTWWSAPLKTDPGPNTRCVVVVHCRTALTVSTDHWCGSVVVFKSGWLQVSSNYMISKLPCSLDADVFLLILIWSLKTAGDACKHRHTTTMAAYKVNVTFNFRLINHSKYLLHQMSHLQLMGPRSIILF